MHRPRTLSFTLLLTVAACGGGGDKNVIAVDGSSTVYPISEAVAEEYKSEGKARVTVGVSGTGGGFQKFCSGEVAITGASRPIKESEAAKCQEKGIEFIELPVAYDGIAIVVHRDNDWVDKLTVAELKKIWEPAAQNSVKRWKDIRPEWPDEEIHLFGPGVDSGTYDYFTQAVVGEEHSSRGDFTSSEDDNVLVQGIANDKLALGFFGFAYYVENTDKLKVVGIDDGKSDNGDGPIEPSLKSVGDGTYQPLSRPVFVYVSKQQSDQPDVAAFVDFYLNKAPSLVREVGYIPLGEPAYGMVSKRFSDRTAGSIFGGKGSKIGATVEQALQAG